MQAYFGQKGQFRLRKKPVETNKIHVLAVLENKLCHLY